LLHCLWDLGFSVVKSLPANAGDMGSIPELGRSPGGGHGNPLQCCLVHLDTLGTPVDSLLWHLLHPLLFWVLMGHGRQGRMLRKAWFSTSGLRHTFIIRQKSWILASKLRHQSILSNLVTVPPSLSAPNCSSRCLQVLCSGG